MIDRQIRDQIGSRGEVIFSWQISAFHGPTGSLFRPHFLGDKWPFADFIVECYDNGPTAPFFFVQVRTTQLPRLSNGALRIHVDADHITGLVRYPAPTYIVGVHEPTMATYIISANGERNIGISSIPTMFPLDAKHRQVLWSEVKRFWQTPTGAKLTSAFISETGD